MLWVVVGCIAAASLCGESSAGRYKVEVESIVRNEIDEHAEAVGAAGIGLTETVVARQLQMPSSCCCASHYSLQNFAVRSRRLVCRLWGNCRIDRGRLASTLSWKDGRMGLRSFDAKRHDECLSAVTLVAPAVGRQHWNSFAEHLAESVGLATERELMATVPHHFAAADHDLESLQIY